MAEKEIECPSCALNVEGGLEVCPYCGYEFPQQNPSLKYAAVLMAVLLLGWIMVGC